MSEAVHPAHPALPPALAQPAFRFNRAAVRHDPYPIYARLRRDSPVVRLRRPLDGASYLVCRYDDVAAVLKDDERFANDRRNAGRADSWLARRLSLSLSDAMVMRDGVDHRRLRTLVHKAFTPARVEALGSRIFTLVSGLLDRMQARGVSDVIADLAFPLPITVICEMMGVPERDRPAFCRWMRGLLDMESRGVLGLFTMAPRLVMLFRFFRRQIAERRERRGDDLLSAMVTVEEGGERLSSDELIASTFLLLLAGHETTVNLISSGLLALLDHPDQLERLRKNPDLIDPAIEELLRFTSPVQIPAPRFARQEVRLCGVTMPRGARISAAIGSANHDESRFSNPEKLDLGRSPNKHLAFGAGAHYCVGAPLARMEARAALLGFLERFPAARLSVPRDRITWRRTLSLRGLESLPLQLN